MSVDNRTDINDCEDDAQTFSTGGGALGTNTAAGNLIEGSGSVQTRHSNAYEETYTTTDSAGTTLNIAASDITIYMLVKDNGVDTDSVSGMHIYLSDGGDDIGYTTGGSDAPGVPLQKQFAAVKLDCSDAAANPGTADVDHHVYTGTEAGLNFGAISEVGYGSLHSAKAQGNVANVWLDAMCYIANDSYALTINGGTSGTPETMADVVSDDEGGLLTGLGYGGLVSNPLGSLYFFVGPTEWGNASTIAEHAFTATDEQWYWIGDNLGGRAVGSTHFPFRVISNSTDTGSFIINGVVVVNTGTASEFDCSDTNVETLEIDGCSFTGLASFEAPASGGTSRFCTNTSFNSCGQVTSNLCDMSGNSYLTSTVVADVGALVYDEALSASKELTTLDNSTFSQGATNHHAITFGTGIDEDITLTGIEFTDFSGTADADGATVQFLATTGSLNLNLVNCTVGGAAPTWPGNFGVDDAAGIAVTVVIAPVVTKFTVQDEDMVDIENARVFAETADNGGGSGFPYQASTTSLTQAAGTATCDTTANHLLETGDQVVIRGAQPDGYNKVASITKVDDDTFTYSVDSGLSSPATGTPIVSYVPIHGLTDSNGEIESSKSWPASQGLMGWARKSSDTLKQSNIVVADASGGTDQLVTLSPDE